LRWSIVRARINTVGFIARRERHEHVRAVLREGQDDPEGAVDAGLLQCGFFLGISLHVEVPVLLELLDLAVGLVDHDEVTPGFFPGFFPVLDQSLTDAPIPAHDVVVVQIVDSFHLRSFAKSFADEEDLGRSSGDERHDPDAGEGNEDRKEASEIGQGAYFSESDRRQRDESHEQTIHPGPALDHATPERPDRDDDRKSDRGEQDLAETNPPGRTGYAIVRTGGQMGPSRRSVQATSRSNAW
jgi:hypothetical protein